MNLTSAYAVLCEAARAPQSPQQELLDIDGTFYVQLGLFVVLAFALSKLLWQPYLRVKSERIRRVDGYKADAKAMDVDAQTRLTKVEAELAEARRTGSADRTRARAEAQVIEAKLIAQAQEAAQKSLTDARARVEASLAAERAKLPARAAALGLNAAERVLGRKVGVA